MREHDESSEKENESFIAVGTVHLSEPIQNTTPISNENQLNTLNENIHIEPVINDDTMPTNEIIPKNVTIQRNRPKKRKRNPEQWAKNQRKQQRTHGHEYKGVTGKS